MDRARPIGGWREPARLHPVEHPPRRGSAEARDLPRFRFSILAPPPAAAAALMRLPSHRHVVTVTTEASPLTDLGDVVLLVLDDAHTARPLGAVPCVAWNRTGADAVALAAYEQGARVVLPADVDGRSLLAALERIAGGAHPSSTHAARGRRSYPEGSRIALGDDQVLCVESGVVAQRVIHADGTHVLIGLFGPKRIVVGHPDDHCCLDLVAHTPVDVTCQRWDEAAGTPGSSQALRVRLRQMEAWAAAQARPHLDGRLLGVLSVLAEQFGRPYSRGVLIDVRLTHDQLASATAATRATVTRALGQLRRRGAVWTVESGGGPRLCLDHVHAHDHAG